MLLCANEHLHTICFSLFFLLAVCPKIGCWNAFVSSLCRIPVRGDQSHFFRLRLRSCSIIFEIRVRLFFKFENPTPVQTPAKIIDPTVVYPRFYQRNDRADSCYCRNGKVTPDPGPVFHKFLTPDPGLKEKRRKKNAEFHFKIHIRIRKQTILTSKSCLNPKCHHYYISLHVIQLNMIGEKNLHHNSN